MLRWLTMINFNWREKKQNKTKYKERTKSTTQREIEPARLIKLIGVCLRASVCDRVTLFGLYVFIYCDSSRQERLHCPVPSSLSQYLNSNCFFLFHTNTTQQQQQQ